jgi:hypothetical protein
MRPKWLRSCRRANRHRNGMLNPRSPQPERGLRVLAEFCTYGETDGHSIWPFGVAVDKHDTVYGRAIPTATSTSPTGAITAFAFLTRKAPR